SVTMKLNSNARPATGPVCDLALDRFLPRSPLCLAKPAGLQGLNHAQGLFSRAPDVQVVDHFVAQNTFRVYYEQPAKRNAFVFDQDAIVACDLFRRVSGERVTQAFNAAFVARRLKPRAVRKDRIGRDAEH